MNVSFGGANASEIKNASPVPLYPELLFIAAYLFIHFEYGLLQEFHGPGFSLD